MGEEGKEGEGSKLAAVNNQGLKEVTPDEDLAAAELRSRHFKGGEQ